MSPEISMAPLESPPARQNLRSGSRTARWVPTAVGLVTGVLALGPETVVAADGGKVPATERPHPRQVEVISDALEFFRRLAARYRAIEHYVEDAEVVQVLEDPATDAPAIRTEVRTRSRIADDRLEVTTSSMLEEVVELVESESPEPVSESDLRLLPHLRLRFDETPLESFRPGAREPFRAGELDRIVVDDRELVKVELLSGSTGAPEARFSLFVDPDRMLVERVEGDEWLPGGLRHRTTVRIESQEVIEIEGRRAVDSDDESAARESGSVVPGEASPSAAMRLPSIG